MSVRINRDSLTQKQIDDIRKHLCIQPKTTGYFKKKRFAKAKDPILAWYLDKPKNEVVVPYTFGNVLMGEHINSKKTYPGGKYNFTGKLRPNQIPVVQQSQHYLDTTGTTTLAVFPGMGKTIMSAMLGSTRGGLVMVIYPIKMVEPGWINTFKQFTDAQVWHNNGKTPMPSSCNVILTMDTQFHKIHPKVLGMVRTLILDEAHMFCVPSRIHCFFGVSPQYIIACTATPDRTDGMEKILHAVCGKHGVYLKSPKRFTVYRLLTGIETEIKKTKNGDTDWPALVRDLSEDATRNAMIVDLVERNAEHKIMILTWNKAHVLLLRDILIARGISVDTLSGNKNTYKDSRILIGTYSKIGCGFDEQMSCPNWGGQKSNMMILTGSTKSLTGLEQFTGRVFRSDFPTIIDMVDNNRICKSHWSQRKKWYEDEGRNGEIHYIEMKKDEGYQGNAKVGGELTNERLKTMNKRSVNRAKAKLNIIG